MGSHLLRRRFKDRQPNLLTIEGRYLTLFHVMWRHLQIYINFHVTIGTLEPSNTYMCLYIQWLSNVDVFQISEIWLKMVEKSSQTGCHWLLNSYSINLSLYIHLDGNGTIIATNNQRFMVAIKEHKPAIFQYMATIYWPVSEWLQPN